MALDVLTSDKQAKKKHKDTSLKTASDIEKIINGELKLEFKVIDYSTPEQQEKLRKLKKAQDEIMKRTQVNRPKLKEFRITI